MRPQDLSGLEAHSPGADSLDMQTSMERREQRLAIATEKAKENYETDDLEVSAIGDNRGEMVVESVDGGYWVSARVWVDADVVERELPPDPRVTKTDEEALDELNLLLSAPEWPGASGMEDVCVIVRATGRREVPNAPHWERH